jgi:hypothetical protein
MTDRQPDHFAHSLRRSAGRAGGHDGPSAHSIPLTGGRMKHRQSHVLETLRQVQVFLDANATAIGPAFASSRRNLDDVVTQLTTYANAQEVGTISSRGETAKQRALRDALREDHMEPIAEVARQKLRDVPEFRALVMPPSNATSTQLIARATAMAEAAQAHEQVFKEIGLPDDFIASLRTLAAEVAQSIDDRKQHASKRSGATAGLDAEEKRGRGVLRLINALVVPRLRKSEALLAEWRSAKRVPRKPGPVATAVSAVAVGTVGTPTAA